MDEARARRLTEELVGTSVGGWHLLSFAGAGKSALVFKATRDDAIAAVKIFDPELIDRFGRHIQLGRIGRELRLKGLHHPHLIRILDGGECATSQYLFVAMEYLDAPNLGKLLKVVPRDRIWPIISQIAKAAQFLEEHELAHRDIKPENIAIDRDFQHATLLDLGVLRPFGDPSLTDEQARPFIGTLRYSSPEFLLRQEQDTRDGWRAVTFYQLGAVLHDMIMGEPLFTEYSEPYAVLVDAVKSKRPRIEGTDVAPDLIVLASNCLVKVPTVRNEIVNWTRFDPPSTGVSAAEAAKARVRHRQLQTKADTSSSESGAEQTGRAQKRLLAEVRLQVDTLVRQECKESFPRFETTEPKTAAHDEAYLRLSFEQSADHSVAGNLSIFITVNILDLDAQALKLSCAAGMALAELADSTLINSPSRPVLFAGVYDKAVVEARVRDMLYVALDAAQSISQIQLEASPIAWLDLAGGPSDV